MSAGNGTSTFANATYTYDTMGRIATVGNSTDTLTYTYVPETGMIASSSWQTATVNTAYTYDSYKRLTNIAVNNTSVYGYTLNDKNQRTGATLPDGRTWSYSYDTLGQLTGAVKRDSANTQLADLSYLYDQIGNRTSATENNVTTSYTSNLVNQYTQVASQVPTYDADGNMLTYNGWTYTWNGENRLTAAESSNTRLEFSYDYMGRRLEKKVYDADTLTSHRKFVYDGYKLIAEFDALAADALVASHLWQPESAGLDVPLMRIADNTETYYIVNGNKNVIALKDSSGADVSTYNYTPFGTLENPADGDENPFRFRSEYHDDETELVYYNYRYYSPQLGRWTKRDPIEEEGGMNVYQMLNNNAINKLDYLGMDDDCCGGKKLSPYECCHNDRAMKLSVDIKKEGEKCCVKLVKICITSHGLHQNICIGMNCYSFGIRDDLLYWAALVSRYFNSGETYVDIPGKEEKCFTVKKSIADSLKNSMDLQVGQRSPYHVTNIGTWGNNCRAYSQVLYNEFSSNEYSGNLPECSNNDSNTRNTSPRK